MDEKLSKIINHYGADNQLKKLNEEFFELIEAIINYRYVECYEGSPAEKYQKEHVEDEFADVYVLLRQFEVYLKLDLANIGKRMHFKTERQLGRMKEEE